MEQLGKLSQATCSLDRRAPCLETDRAKGLNKAQETQALVSLAASKVPQANPPPLSGLRFFIPKASSGSKILGLGDSIKPCLHMSAEIPREHVITGT